jgi:FAD/FMN-containing dehydrogenase
MAKHVVASNLTAPAVVFDGVWDYTEFEPNYLVLLTEATDVRQHVSWAYPSMHKITISPIGKNYVGDAVPGDGAYKVTINFAGAIPNVVMTRVESINTSAGWLVITKGEDLIVYSPTIMYQAIVEPTT